MKFTKMHGCGNDYVYVDCTVEKVDAPEEVSRFVSDRHFGIGSDGLILICPSKVADLRMRMFNADGSEGAMCGNGIRCVGKYAFDHGLVHREEITVETGSGIKTLQLHTGDGRVQTVTVDMGKPETAPEKIPVKLPEKVEAVIDYPIMTDGTAWRITCVSMGNPHGVVFVEENRTLDLPKIGPLFEHHPWFPDRINTEFIKILSREEISMRVWERGSGETMACGTGACASVVAAVLNDLTEETVMVHLLGGDLRITYDRAAERVWMEGSATEVFSGEISYPQGT